MVTYARVSFVRGGWPRRLWGRTPHEVEIYLVQRSEMSGADEGEKRQFTSSPPA